MSRDRNGELEGRVLVKMTRADRTGGERTEKTEHDNQEKAADFCG